VSVPNAPSDDDVAPVSVRLGEVVPPEDPEDWTRPLTWIAALGMLAGPLTALAWFLLAPPAQGGQALPATLAVGTAVAAGAGATGATQQGSARAGTATLGAGLFGALAVIIVGVAMAGERQVAVASPTLSHAFGAAAGGLAGVAVGSIVAALTARRWPRPVRFAAVFAVAVAVTVVVISLLMPAPVQAASVELTHDAHAGRGT
jgi:hypothetical protein